jgi:hypothetical protein
MMTTKTTTATEGHVWGGGGGAAVAVRCIIMGETTSRMTVGDNRGHNHLIG